MCGNHSTCLTNLVDGDSVHVGVVHEPDDLVGEELSVVLRGQVGLSGLGGVELQALADALPQHVQGRVGLHDLGHGLLDQRLGPGEPVPIGTVIHTHSRNTSLHYYLQMRLSRAIY